MLESTFIQFMYMAARQTIKQNICQGSREKKISSKGLMKVEWKGQPFETAPHTFYNSAIDAGKGFNEWMRIIIQIGGKNDGENTNDFDGTLGV